MASIDVGEAAIDRATKRVGGYTVLNEGNPANATGLITQVQVYAYESLSGFYVGIFYNTAGSNYKCRSAAFIGTVVAGAPRTFEVSLEIQAGDLIGCYFSVGGRIERSDSGYGGELYVSGNKVVVDNESGYNTLDGNAISLHGEGAEQPSAQPYSFIM